MRDEVFNSLKTMDWTDLSCSRTILTCYYDPVLPMYKFSKSTKSGGVGHRGSELQLFKFVIPVFISESGEVGPNGTAPVRAGLPPYRQPMGPVPTGPRSIHDFDPKGGQD